jgi:hypothetical protein
MKNRAQIIQQIVEELKTGVFTLKEIANKLGFIDNSVVRPLIKEVDV